MKVNRCRTTGLDSQRQHLPEAASTTQAVELVTRLAHDDAIVGILVQHPMAQPARWMRAPAGVCAQDVDQVTVGMIKNSDQITSGRNGRPAR